MSRIIFNFQINKQIGLLESFLAGKDEGKAEEEEGEEEEDLQEISNQLNQRLHQGEFQAAETEKPNENIRESVLQARALVESPTTEH